MRFHFSKNVFSIVWIAITLPGITANAQFKTNSLANGILPEVVPSSPEASSLGKFGEWPVSEYTGVPNISIPIHTISVGGFQLPIQLSYHASGVKVDEVSSWVGTNWSLNAGGVINRTIVGIPDETINSGFLYRNLSGNKLKASYDLTNANDYVFFRNVDAKSIDVEPDIFYFNFGSYSGKFYFDQTGKFQCIPVNSLKLLRCPVNNTTNSDDQHWEIADPAGNVYFFASYQNNGQGFETTNVKSVNSQGSASVPRISAWYLTKIAIANSTETIYFDYTSKTEIYDLPNTYTLKQKINAYGDADVLVAGTDLKIDAILANGTNGNAINTNPNDYQRELSTKQDKMEQWRS